MSEIVELSYFQQRMQLLGITDEINTVKLGFYNAKIKDNDLEDVPVFTETEKGIDILVYGIDRSRINYKKEGSRFKINDYKITRLEFPIIKKDGSEMKYQMPKGVQTHPFFPPALLDKYEQKASIPVLYLTEGYFKAFKAQMHNIDCVGLPSITCMKDKETGALHRDIKLLIEACRVQRVVWLTDGDCRNLTSKDIQDGADLSKRPVQFFRTVSTFYELLSKYDDVQKYFAHINTDNLEGNPKGLDDLLCAFPDDAQFIKYEAESFDKITQGVYIGAYFVKMNITWGVGRVQRYFLLHDVDTFYLHHVEQRPEIKGKSFKFYGTLYYYDEDENKCVVKIPSDASRYFRVGDSYYEYVDVPNKYNELTKTFHRRQKETIKDDNGKDIFKHVPKYKAFCNVPDHVNYQRVISNCFNIYSPFIHEMEDGNYSTTLDFIKHIFGEDPVKVDEENTVARYELGLDYLTLLYKRPQQILPILCLVSTERQTGKTTFLKWLDQVFSENVAIVGNEDLANNFNSHWSSKLLIGCDETKIDKHTVLEKVKSLSTASKIMKEGKGVDQVAMDFFGKFLFLSNNEDNFINIDEEEIRFWIIKVPTIKGRNVELISELIDEIPAFLYFLNSRPMVTEYKERHWFETRLLKTEALGKVVLNSKPSIEKILRTRIAQYFMDIDTLEVLTMPFYAVREELLKRTSFDDNYIKRTLNSMGYKTHPVARTNFPRLTESKQELNGGGPVAGYISVPFHTTYYEFPRTDFADLIEVEREIPEIAQPATEIPDDVPF